MSRHLGSHDYGKKSNRSGASWFITVNISPALNIGAVTINYLYLKYATPKLFKTIVEVPKDNSTKSNTSKMLW